MTDQPYDEDGDGRYEALLVRSTVRLPARGKYTALVSLVDARGRLIAYGTADRNEKPAAALPIIRLDAAGPRSVPLRAWFDGEAIAREGTPGRLRVRIVVSPETSTGSAPAPGRLFEGRTRMLDPRRFGSAGPRVDSLVWRPGPGDTLKTWVDLEVRRAGTYVVETNVSLNTTWIGRAESTSSFAAGRHRVALAAPIAELAEKLRDGASDRLTFEVQVFSGTERVATWKGGGRKL